MTAMPSSAVRPPADRAERTVTTTFVTRRAAQIAEDRRRREQRFDAELARRLALFRAGLPLPHEPIADNPYIARPSAVRGVVLRHPAVPRTELSMVGGRA
jgi:hypothetical protein